MALENAIRRCRRQAALRQQDLADALGVSKAVVCGWETGRFDPTPRHAIALTKVLRCLKFEDIYPLPESNAA